MALKTSDISFFLLACLYQSSTHGQRQQSQDNQHQAVNCLHWTMFHVQQKHKNMSQGLEKFYDIILFTAVLWLWRLAHALCLHPLKLLKHSHKAHLRSMQPLHLLHFAVQSGRKENLPSLIFPCCYWKKKKSPHNKWLIWLPKSCTFFYFFSAMLRRTWGAGWWRRSDSEAAHHRHLRETD